MMGLWFLSSTVAHYISGFLAKETTKPIIELASGIDEGNFIDGLNKKMIGEENYQIYADTYNITDSLYKELGFEFTRNYNEAKIIAEILDEEGEKMFDLENALKKGGQTYNWDHSKLLRAEKDSLNKYVEIHKQIANLEKDSTIDNSVQIQELKNILLNSSSIWAKKGKSGFVRLGVGYEALDSGTEEGRDTTKTIRPLLRKLEQKIYVLDAAGDIAMIENEEGEKVQKLYDLTAFQQNYLESNFRYKQGYFEEGSEIVKRSQFATFISMRYNNLYGKIGFMTLLIALGTFIFSPVIKKLMGDVH